MLKLKMNEYFRIIGNQHLKFLKEKTNGYWCWLCPVFRINCAFGGDIRDCSQSEKNEAK
jgi:hypothetical protein